MFYIKKASLGVHHLGQGVQLALMFCMLVYGKHGWFFFVFQYEHVEWYLRKSVVHLNCWGVGWRRPLLTNYASSKHFYAQSSHLVIVLFFGQFFSYFLVLFVVYFLGYQNSVILLWKFFFSDGTKGFASVLPTQLFCDLFVLFAAVRKAR